jgi:hypothetical protein
MLKTSTSTKRDKPSPVQEDNKENRSIITSLTKSILSKAADGKDSQDTQLSATLDSQISTFDSSPVKRRRFQEQLLNSTTDDTQKFLTLRENKEFNSQSSSNTSTLSDSELLALEMASCGGGGSSGANEATVPPNELFYGLPALVQDLLKKFRNISCLYEWQDELMTIMIEKYQKAIKCLKEKGRDWKKNVCTNLLYLSPTSGGKTLVAELLIFHTLLVRKRDCIFVMPFVSIVQEKVQMLNEFAEQLGFYVEEYAGVRGMIPPVKRIVSKNKHTIYICTIEKAHSLVNSLIENDRLGDEIGLVVAGNVHLIN